MKAVQGHSESDGALGLVLSAAFPWGSDWETSVYTERDVTSTHEELHIHFYVLMVRTGVLLRSCYSLELANADAPLATRSVEWHASARSVSSPAFQICTSCEIRQFVC